MPTHTPTAQQVESAKRYKLFREPLQRADGFWIISDLYACAFLIARGNELVGIEPNGQSKRLSFVICAGREFAADHAAFASNCPIPIRDFLDAVYLVKEKMREATV